MLSDRWGVAQLLEAIICNSFIELSFCFSQGVAQKGYDSFLGGVAHPY